MASRKTVATKPSTEEMPASIKPMLCTLLHQPFRDPDYIFEIKWDGYRIIAYKSSSAIKLASRGGEDYTTKYPPVVKALKSIPGNIVLDGEVVVLDREGKPDFDALQRFNGQKSGALYYVFDILWKDGTNLTTLPLLERKTILFELIGDNDVIRYSDHFDDGVALFEHARSLGLEGIVAKRKSSLYIPDKRGRDWFKIPTSIRQEFVIGGWIESQSGRLFRTLLFGAYAGKELKWIGHAGGGYKEHEMPGILKKLKELEIEKSPFSNEVEYEGIVHWVKPLLVANIKYATTTRSGKIRKPAIFLGFRADKAAAEVIEDTPVGSSTPVLNPDSNWSVVDAEPVRNHDVLDLGECTVKVHNVDRLLWKQVTKGDLLQYYHSVANYILPHLKNRPLSLYLKLKGPHAPGIYIKDMEGRQPDCADLFTTPRLHKKEGKRDIIDYLVCNNKATLLYVVNLGCIDLNPWTSTRVTPHEPDFIIIDLDPSDDDFNKAIQAAQAAQELFQKQKLKAFAKTSGKTGIHLFIPCRNLSFAQARSVAENMCQEIHRILPELTTTEVSKKLRGNRLYLDPNQNDYADTVASVYSVRPASHPNVSTPIEWKELNGELSPDQFTLDEIQKRLAKKGDLFLGVLDETIAVKNEKILRKFL